MYVDSDGTIVENPRHYRKAEHRLKRLHRRLSRKQKGGKNRKKARKALAKGYLKVQRQREDFARKQASALVSSRDVIAYEQLQIRNMVKKSLSVRTHICTGCGAVLDRDHNAARNILAKALEGTLGHRGTSTSVENASGQTASTRPRRAKTGKRAG